MTWLPLDREPSNRLGWKAWQGQSIPTQDSFSGFRLMRKISIQEALSAIFFSIVMIAVSLGNAYAVVAVAGIGAVLAFLFRRHSGSCPLWAVYASYGVALVVSLARLFLHKAG